MIWVASLTERLVCGSHVILLPGHPKLGMLSNLRLIIRPLSNQASVRLSAPVFGDDARVAPTMSAMTKVSIRSGLPYEELRSLVRQTQAAQVSPYEGTATLVTLPRPRRRVLSSSGVARALRSVELPGDEPVFLAVPELTAEALDYLASLNVWLLRDPPQSVVTRSDYDVSRR
jgi:hypothetical protein